MPDNAKQTEKKVADLEKEVKALQAQLKTALANTKEFEAKIKVLAENSLDSKGLDKFIDAHFATAIEGTEKQIEKAESRLEDLVDLQGKKERSETEKENEKHIKEAEKQTQKMIADYHKSMVEARLSSLEARTR